MRTTRITTVATLVLALSMALPPTAHAQRSDTIYQRLFNATTGLSFSPAVRNIGQSSHVLFVVVQDNGGVPACDPGPGTSAQINLFLEGGHDGLLYGALTPRSILLTPFGGSSWYGFTVAYGAYPYIRARYSGGLGISCSVSAYYTGTVQAGTQPQDRMGVQSGYRSNAIRVNVDTRTPLVANTGGGSQDSRVVIYGVWLHNEAGTVNSTKLVWDSTSCSGAVTVGTVGEITNIAAGGQVTWPSSIVPWSVGPTNSSLCAEQTAATSMYYVVIFRVE